MTDVTILGVTFPNIDFLELETVTAYEAGLNKLQHLIDDPNNRRVATHLIIEASNTAYEWADDVLGEGAGEKLFQGKKSLSIVMEIMKCLGLAYAKSIADFRADADATNAEMNTLLNRQNRDQRREQERQKHKNSRKKNNRKNSNYQTSPAPVPLHIEPEPYTPEPAPDQTE